MRLNDANGHWALITGASAGIGAEFCRQLASAGMNIAMVARREQKLNELADQIAKTHRVENLVLPIDLSEPNSASDVKSELDKKGVKVRLLCNNAAIIPWCKFEQVSAHDYEQIIHLNTASLVSLCRHLLPHLTSYPTSVIINPASGAAFQPVPYLAVYAATKAFVYSFSLALSEEWAENGVYVQTLLPDNTESEYAQKTNIFRTLKMKTRTPDEIVKASLSKIGTSQLLVTNIRGLTKQRILTSLAPPKTVLKFAKKMFCPPDPARNQLY